MRVGSTFRLFGKAYTITIVEPATDYAWHVEAEDVAGETLTMTIPSATRTV